MFDQTQLPLLDSPVANEHPSRDNESDLDLVSKAAKDTNVKYCLFEDGSKRRYFISPDGQLCQYSKGRTRWGSAVSSLDSRLKKIVYHDDRDTAEFKKVSKYRRYAEKASFSNPFIKTCLGLPETHLDWELDGKRSIYDYRVTTGCTDDAKVIGVRALESVFPGIGEQIATRSDFRSWREPFRGLEASYQLKSVVENGEQHYLGWLSMEYKDCLNGHYYLLINDESFIYYEKD